LKQCIDSLLALSLRPYEREIIVVDDGSDASPLPYLSDYQDDIIYVRQKNGGLSTARNTGLRLATGQYVQFVDADDMLITVAYEHCLDFIRYEKPDMVMFDFTHRPIQSTIYEDSPLMSGCELLRHRNIRGTACGYLFKRTALGQLRFTPGILHEDEEFTPQLLLRCDTVRITNAQAYLYRQREESIMTAAGVRHRLQRLGDAKQILFRLQTLADTLPAEGHLALSRRVHQLTMDYIYNVIRLTGNLHYLERQLQELRTNGLYPLPKCDYTKKYSLFRRLANSRVGLKMLMRAIPVMTNEK
jgi:glycosyltransferase involved in cell wall biosynthesis